MSDQDTMKVLRFLVAHDATSDKFFYEKENGDIGVSENCNDLFWWACADVEEITPNDLSLFEQCIKDCEAIENFYSAYAGTVFVCRKRGLRPQNACYPDYPKELWLLLDSAGPERPADGKGNPYSREKAEQKYAEKHKVAS